MAGGTKQSRRGVEPRHIRLYHSVTGSAAWQDLSGNAIKLLISMLRLEHGSNNGALFMSSRNAAKLIGVARTTAVKLLVELEDHGFIRTTEKGYFEVKGGPATAYRFTWLAWPGHFGPTRDFEKWEPVGNKTRYQFTSATVPETGPPEKDDAPTVPEIGTSATETSHVSTSGTGPETGTQTVCQGLGSRCSDNTAWKQHPHLGGPRGDDDETAVREKLKSLLQASPAGTQTRLAEAASIPGGTLSKFLRDGKRLSAEHRTRLLLNIPKLEEITGGDRAAG